MPKSIIKNEITPFTAFYFVTVSVVTFVSISLAYASFGRSNRVGPIGRTGVQGDRGDKGNTGPPGQGVPQELFLYESEQQAFPTSAFYVVNFTKGGINNTNFDGVGYIAPQDGIYSFTTFLEFDLVVDTLSHTTVFTAYLVNDIRKFAFDSYFYFDHNEILQQVYVIWSSRLNEGDRITVQIFAFGAANLESTVEMGSFFMGTLIAN